MTRMTNFDFISVHFLWLFILIELRHQLVFDISGSRIKALIRRHKTLSEKLTETHNPYFEMHVSHLKFGINHVLRTQNSLLIRANSTLFVLLHCSTVVFYLCHLLCHSLYVITHDAITIAINITNTFFKKGYLQKINK